MRTAHDTAAAHASHRPVTATVMVVRAAVLVAFVLVRAIGLRSDPPSWLSWSTGISTDEGFYTLDARSEVLFHHWAIGNFHDRLLSPILSLLQQGVFELFGPRLLVARLLSVAFSIALLCVFWGMLRRLINEDAANFGTCILGLSPAFVFYNRMALQETPTVFWLVAAAYVAGAGSMMSSARQVAGSRVLSGVSAALAIVFKPLAGLALPAIIFLWVYGSKNKSHPRASNLWIPLCAFGVSMAFYGALWYLPHYASLSRMDHFYRVHQLQPHTTRELALNVRRALIGGDRGVLPYLLALMPVPCVLAGWGLRSARRVNPHARIAAIFFGVWLSCGLLFCAFSSYAPSRYYVLFLPALAGLAAAGWRSLPQRIQAVFAVLFVISCVPWYVTAILHVSNTRRAASSAMGAALPVHSVVVGEFAPILCLNTPFADAPVQPGLSNSVDSVQFLHATVIAVRRTPGWVHWWHEKYPQIILPSHRIATVTVQGPGTNVIDLYQVAPGGVK